MSYVVNVLLGGISGISEGSSLIEYCTDLPEAEFRGIRIIPSGFFGCCYGTKDSLPKLPVATVEEIPFLFGIPKVERSNRVIVVHADLIASAFFLLTRYEEWVLRHLRDTHGRFPGTASTPYLGGLIERPVVDEYRSLIITWLREIGFHSARLQGTPNFLLTHDVDFIGAHRRIRTGIAAAYRACLNRGPWKSIFSAIGLAKHPWDNLGDVIEMDQTITLAFPHAIRSCYFFMAGGNTTFDGNYKLDSSRGRAAVRNVLESGAEVGLHASYAAGTKPDLLESERASLESIAHVPVSRNRHHFLRWREIEHGYAIKKAGISHDSTLGYADTVGFRLGTSHPVALFDPVLRQPLGIEEHPLDRHGRNAF